MDRPWGHIEHPRNDLEADSLLGGSGLEQVWLPLPCGVPEGSGM